MQIGKPEKQGIKLPFINHTQNERGVTLIALIVSIIILILLAAVSIKAITGEEGILKVSTDATEDYNILQYKEQIEQLRESIILKAEIAGENINLEKLAREMSKEATWIKSAVANVSDGASELNNDIIVTTTDGYIFQLYYSESYGQKFIEYLGKEDGNAIPEVTVSKVNNKITAIATEDASGINSIDVIYKGYVVTSEKASTLEYELPKTGWYTIRVTSSKGKLRYAWVRVSSTLVAPKIEIINPSTKPASGWYKEKVTVRISAQSEKVSKIYYTTSRWKEDPILEITSSDQINGTIAKDIEITLQGATNIYAYAVDESNGESEIVRQDILIDSEPPVINDIIITGTKGENGWYRGDVGISLENAKDNASGVAGYGYYIPTTEEIASNFIPEISQMLGENGQIGGSAINISKIMKITEDGIKTVIIRLVDRAGNISNPVTVTVKADNTPPAKPTVNYDEVRPTSFVLTSETTDNLSSITYDFYIIEKSRGKLVGSTKAGECLVENLDPSTQYTVYVEARDEAGNMTRSDNVTITTKKAVNPPKIEIIPKDGTERLQNNWYGGDVEVRISFTAQDPDNPLKIKYKVKGATNIVEKTEENEITFDITAEGISTITAWTEDSEENKSQDVIEEAKIDLSEPESPVITVTGERGEDPKWFNSNMLVTITGRKDSGADIAKIRYEITKNGERIINSTPNGAVTTRVLKEDRRIYSKSMGNRFKSEENQKNIQRKLYQKTDKNQQM